MSQTGSKKNIIGWAVVSIITICSFLFIYFGPETHSNDQDAPTFISRIVDLVFIFLISGAFFLPLRKSNRINLVVIIGGAACLIFGLGSMFITILPKDIHQEGILLAWGLLLAGIIALVLVGLKIKKAFNKTK